MPTPQILSLIYPALTPLTYLAIEEASSFPQQLDPSSGANFTAPVEDDLEEDDEDDPEEEEDDLDEEEEDEDEEDYDEDEDSDDEDDVIIEDDEEEPVSEDDDEGDSEEDDPDSVKKLMTVSNLSPSPRFRAARRQ